MTISVSSKHFRCDTVCVREQSNHSEQTDRLMDEKTDWTDKQTFGQNLDRYIDRQTDGQKERQKERRTERETERETDRNQCIQTTNVRYELATNTQNSSPRKEECGRAVA